MKTLILSFIFLLRTILSSGQIIFESTDISFDTIYNGQIISKTLFFINNSSNTIEINQTTPFSEFPYSFFRFMPRELLPNKRDSIELVVKTSRNFNSEGLKNITATIYFDNGTSQLINLKGFIKPELLNFYTSEHKLELIKNKQDYQFTITNIGDSVIFIERIDVTNIHHYFYIGDSVIYVDQIMTASVDKKKLLKNDTAIITAVIKKELVQEEFLQTRPKIDMNSEETQENAGLTLQFSVILKDCCGLTQERIIFNIEYFEYEK